MKIHLFENQPYLGWMRQCSIDALSENHFPHCFNFSFRWTDVSAHHYNHISAGVLLSGKVWKVYLSLSLSLAVAELRLMAKDDFLMITPSPFASQKLTFICASFQSFIILILTVISSVCNRTVMYN